MTSPLSRDPFYPILIKSFVPRCLPRSLMEKLWTCGASEWSLTSSSAATRLSTMRTMQIYSLRFSKVGRQYSDFVILLFFLRRVRVRLALLGRYQRRGKRLHSLTHVCQRREQTYLPVSFLQFTFTFMSSWSLSLSLLWLIPFWKNSKDMYVPASVSESHTFYIHFLATKITLSLFYITVPFLICASKFPIFFYFASYQLHCS